MIMANVLPETEKKRIYHEYLLRLVAVVFVLATVSFVISTVFLAPVYLLSLAKNRATAERAAVLKQSIALEDKMVVEIFVSMKKRLAFLAAHRTSPSSLNALTAILNNRTEDIELTFFFFEADEKGEATLSLEGVATSRNALAGFAKKLEKEPLFERVKLPVSNLAQDRDIEFSLNVDIATTP